MVGQGRRRRWILAAALAVLAAGAGIGFALARPPAAQGAWATRTVWACDHRKAVIVEGVPPGERIPRERAQLVADILSQLMHYCDAEITARIGLDEAVEVTLDGRTYQRWVPGQPLPFRLVHSGKPHSARERAIWKAELDRMVAEGQRLWRSGELGSNGLACGMCHPDAASTHPETYPKFQTQLKKVALLRDMINWCIQNPLEGQPLSGDDPRMKALEAYALAQRAGHPLAPGKH